MNLKNKYTFSPETYLEIFWWNTNCETLLELSSQYVIWFACLLIPSDLVIRFYLNLNRSQTTFIFQTVVNLTYLQPFNLQVSQIISSSQALTRSALSPANLWAHSTPDRLLHRQPWVCMDSLQKYCLLSTFYFFTFDFIIVPTTPKFIWNYSD